MENLEQQFVRRLREAMRLYKDLGHQGVFFGQRLDSLGGRETARHYVNSGVLQDGFKHLARIGRLDLSVEQIMLEPEFAPLFTQADLQAASRRLNEVRQAIRRSKRMQVVW